MKDIQIYVDADGITMVKPLSRKGKVALSAFLPESNGSYGFLDTPQEVGENMKEVFELTFEITK